MSPPESPEPSWRSRARTWTDRVLRPLAEQIDREDRMPPEVFRSLGEGGFMGLGVPQEWGGSGGSSLDTASVLEELARVSASVATDLSVHLSVCAAPILRWGSDGQRERYLRALARGSILGAFALSEPGAGSDALHLSCRYEPVNDGYRLRGSKMFITNGASAGVVLAFATRDPALGAAGISAFLVPSGIPGFSVAQRLDKLGLRGSETTELVFDDVRLPPDGRIGGEGQGISIALGALAGGRIGIAACALGVAQGAFDEMRVAAARRPDDANRSRIARAYTDLCATRELVRRAARLRDAGRPFELAASAAKLAASQAAVSIAMAGMDAAGPEAIRRGHPAERMMRDARVFPIVEGTTEIQERILGRTLLEHPDLNADGGSE